MVISAAVVFLISSLIGIALSAYESASSAAKEANFKRLDVAREIANNLKGDVTTWRGQIESQIYNRILVPAGVSTTLNDLNKTFDSKMKNLDKRIANLGGYYYGPSESSTNELKADTLALENEMKQGVKEIKRLHDNAATFNQRVATAQQANTTTNTMTPTVTEVQRGGGK